MQGHWAKYCKSSYTVFDEDKFIQGKLKRNLKFWREVIEPSDFVLNMIQSGYKIPFHTTPDPYYFDIRSSALRRKSFVEFQIATIREHWKNIYKSYHENIMFFREKIINCFLKIIIIMIFFLPIFRLVKNHNN